MLTWKEIVQNYIIKHSDKIKKTTQPLHDHLGINYFTYHRIDLAGKYIVLVDRPGYAEHYVDKKFYLYDPYLREPQLFQSGFSFAQTDGSDEFKKTVLGASKDLLNTDDLAMFIDKQQDFVEFYGFGTDSKMSCLHHLCLNHSQLLKAFALHFQNQLKGILAQMSEEANSLLELKGKTYLSKTAHFPKLKEESRLAYLHQLGLKSEIQKANLLSERERECLRHLIAGKSAKETGSLLGLSSRTIESYFENIKHKFSCWSKAEVLTLAKKLDELALL